MISNYMVFGLAFLVDMVVACIIVLGIYFPTEKDKKYVLTFFAFNISIFLIATLFSQVDLSLGFGFGLFAIFSILRYRSDPLPVREMTYLFILMALPVVTVILMTEGQYLETAIANGVILAVFFVVDRALGFRYEAHKTVTYEKIDWIKPQHYAALLQDLQDRTGLDVIRCEVGKVDFLHDVAEVKIYYQEQPAGIPGEIRKGRQK
jgi:hypothetical protein